MAKAKKSYSTITKDLINQQKNIFKHWLFIASNFIKTPSNFIPIVLYIFYLVLILLIVPKILFTDPLYIWNNSNFNMKIFNLIFIALICGIAASNIFCVHKNDTVQLIVFSKPIPRGWIILNKILFYFLIIIVFTSLIVGICATSAIIFGWHDPIKNINGIKQSDYASLLVSLCVGNLICSTFFIAFGILIGMKHGTTFTMVSSLLIATIFNFFNFTFPIVSSKSADYIKNKYAASIDSFSINTLEQYQDNSLATNDSINVCALWSNEDNLDPFVIQNEAAKNSNEQLFNYFDVGNQLSQLFQCFSSNEASNSAKKLSSFGSDFKSYQYTINEHNVFQSKKTPLFFYNVVSNQGLQIPTLLLLGINLKNAKPILEAANASPNFVSLITKNASSLYTRERNVIDEITKKFDYCYLSIDDLKQDLFSKSDDDAFTSFQTTINNITDYLLEKTAGVLYDLFFKWDKFLWQSLSTNEPEEQQWKNVIDSEETKNLRHLLFENDIDSIEQVKDKDRLLALGQCQLGFFVNLMQRQRTILENYFAAYDPTITYPYSSQQICDFFDNIKSTDEINRINFLLSQLVASPISLTQQNDDNPLAQNKYYLCMPYYRLSYCESINQMHEYKVDNFFPTSNLVAIWSAINILFVTISLCIYWRMDII